MFNKTGEPYESDEEECMIDLNPKKLEKPRDNVFMDFMALYSRASTKDKKGGVSKKVQVL